MADYKDRIRIHIEGKEFSVVGGEFRDMLGAVKQINGRRFVSELKVWQLPGTAEDVQNQLEISGYYLEGGKPIADPAAPAGPSSPSQSRDRIRIKVGGHQLAVAGGSFQEMLAVVKSLPGRRFDTEAKIWEIPGDWGVIQGMIQAAGFELEGTEKISQEPVPEMEMETPQFSDTGEPPPFEPPDFSGDEDELPFEPPDWLDDDQLPPPPEPPDWWDNELEPPPDFVDPDTAPSDNEPSPFTSTSPSPKPIPPSKPGGDRIRIRVGGIPLVVTGGSFRDMLAAIKNIPGRRFNGQDKVWDIPDDIDLESAKQMINAVGFEVDRG